MNALQERVDAHTIEDGDCLLWIGGCCNGHPAIRIDGNTRLVRRVLWQAAHGDIPSGKVVRCTCGMPRCVNLEHCELMTHKRIALINGAAGKMSGPVRSARIAAVKRAGQQARISQEDARVIRASEETLVVLAVRYGIAESTCSRIKLGRVRREFMGNVWQGLAA